MTPSDSAAAPVGDVAEGARARASETSREPRPDDAARVLRFLDRVRAALSHDLGTPLGTIANYAAILEEFDARSSATDVPDLARRVGANAQRAARMVRGIAATAALGARGWKGAPTDLRVLALAMLAEVGLRPELGGSHAAGPARPAIDGEVVANVWRAWLGLECDARRAPLTAWALDVRADAGELCIGLRHGEGTGEAEWLDAARYLRHAGGANRIEHGLAFQLATELVARHAGECRVRAATGHGAELELLVPFAEATR